MSGWTRAAMMLILVAGALGALALGSEPIASALSGAALLAYPLGRLGDRISHPPGVLR